MPCNDACGEESLIDNPQICELTPRLTTPSQLGFYLCNTSWPSPLTPEGIAALINSNEVVWSNPLANVTFNDPTTQDVQISDCLPSSRVVASRELTFQDRVAVSMNGGSPAEEEPFYDYDFWLDKVGKKLSMYYLIRYCNGDVKFANGTNGQPLSADLLVTLNYERATTNGSPSIEFKQGSAIFNGDPLDIRNKPLFNIADNGTITIY